MQQPIIPGLHIPVRTIYCIGRNYAKHAAEMGAEVPSKPVVFLKSLSAICYNDSTIEIPSHSENVHFEGEIVVAIGKVARNIPENKAQEYIAGIGCGIDFTARDLQKDAKLNGLPWSVCKGFENFAPISQFIPIEEIDLLNTSIELRVNNELKQAGNIEDMIFSIPKLIAYLSTIATLYPGDLIFTGTPEGVGPVKEGDVVQASIPNFNTTVSVNIG